jgi:hypothetical protein
MRLQGPSHLIFHEALYMPKKRRTCVRVPENPCDTTVSVRTASFQFGQVLEDDEDVKESQEEMPREGIFKEDRHGCRCNRRSM